MQIKVDTVVICRYTPHLMSYDLALKTCALSLSLSLFNVCYAIEGIGGVGI